MASSMKAKAALSERGDDLYGMKAAARAEAPALSASSQTSFAWLGGSLNFARLQPTSNLLETGNGRVGGDRPYKGGQHGRRRI